MKLLITSDIHGKTDFLEKLRDLHKDIDYHLDAGDLGLTVKKIENLNILSVKGNTDYFLNLPEQRILELDQQTIFITHGHLYDVKYGFSKLIDESLKKHASITIFGHTHTPHIQHVDKLLLLNPGSLKDFPHTYIILENGIPTLHKLKE